MSVDEVFGGGGRLSDSNLTNRQKRLLAKKLRNEFQWWGNQEGISLGYAVENISTARRMGIVQDPSQGAPVEEFFQAMFPNERIGPLPTVQEMSAGAIDPATVPSYSESPASKARRQRTELKAHRKNLKRSYRQWIADGKPERQRTKWEPDTSAAPSPYQADDHYFDPQTPGKNNWQGPRVTQAQRDARTQATAQKQVHGGRRVHEAAQAAEEARPTVNSGSGRNIIREMTRATRRAVDDIAHLETADVKNLFRSTLRGIRGGKAYLDSHSFAEMLSDAEGLLNSSGMVDPKKALKTDMKVFRNIMETIETGVNSPDRRFAYGMLDLIDDHDLLSDIASKIDPLGFKGVRKDGVVGKSAVKEFLRAKIDGAKKTDVVAEQVDDYTRQVTSVRVNKEGRESFARWVDQVMNGDESWHNKGIERARRGEFHFNVAGISQTTHIGTDINRRFDISGGFEYGHIFRGMDVIGPDGKVQSGIINGLGFTRQSLRELERASQAQATDVVGFSMHLMQQNELTFMEVARGRDALGRLTMGHVGNVIFQASAQQRQHFENVSKHAFARQFQLDIETSYGRRRWANEVTKMRGLDMASADDTFDGIVGMNEKSLHSQLAAAVRSGNVDDILEKSKALRESEDVNWITQIAMEEKGRVKGSAMGDFASVERTGIAGFYRGEDNIGVFAGRHMSDSDFDDAIKGLVEERIRQARHGGAITGLNVDKFDMRVIREQAWRTGEEALAQAKKARSALPAGVEATAELTALEKRASLLLAYSGRWTGNSWIAHPDANTKRLTDVINRRVGKAVFAYDVPIADTFQVSDITSNLVRPLASLAVERDADKRVFAAQKHVREHFFGDHESGYISIGKDKVKSQTLLTWGDRNEAVSGRVQSMFRGVDEQELKQVIENAKNSDRGLDTGVTDFLRELHGQQKAGSLDLDARLASGGFSDDQMNDVMDTLKKQWGDDQVKGVLERVKGAPASQESLMYSVDDVWRRLKSGFLDSDGGYYLGKTAHQARRDLRMIDVAEELSFAAFKNTGKFVGATLAKPTKQIIDFATKTTVSLPFVGYRGNGAELVGKIGALLPKLNGEPILAGEMAEYGSSQIAAMRYKARGVIGTEEKFLSRAMQSQARQIKSIIGGELELSRIQKGLRYGYAGLAVTGIAAGAFVAGTVHKKAHQDDESWRYGEYEEPRARKLLKQRMSEAGIGQMVTEMSNRKNYSYNMRPDKHDHLFRG